MAITSETIRMRLAEDKISKKQKLKPEEEHSFAEMIIKLIDAIHAENGEYSREYLVRLANHLEPEQKEKLMLYIQQKKEFEDNITALTKQIPLDVQKQEMVNWVKDNFLSFKEAVFHYLDEADKINPHYTQGFKKEKIKALFNEISDAINKFISGLPLQPIIKSKL